MELALENINLIIFVQRLGIQAITCKCLMSFARNEDGMSICFAS